MFKTNRKKPSGAEVLKLLPNGQVNPNGQNILKKFLLYLLSDSEE